MTTWDENKFIPFKLKCHTRCNNNEAFCSFIFHLISPSSMSCHRARAHAVSQERHFLVASISAEFLISVVFYMFRAFYLNSWGPGTIFLILFLRSQFTNTLTMGLIFLPKLWYQHKQVCSYTHIAICLLYRHLLFYFHFISFHFSPHQLTECSFAITKSIFVMRLMHVMM